MTTILKLVWKQSNGDALVNETNIGGNMSGCKFKGFVSQLISQEAREKLKMIL